jgi:succinate-semialdehyde dehydrogenase/glutarate-semialdehyde dehydrogenase
MAGRPLAEKSRVFDKFAVLLEAHKREIVETVMLEFASSLRGSLYQHKSIADVFRGYVEAAKRFDGRIMMPGSEDGHDGRTLEDLQMVVYEPVGTVLALVPSSAPLNMFAFKVAPALAAGNAVIAKLPSSCPLALLKVVALLREAGVPGNAMQAITGTGSIVGDKLVKDARIDAVTLTGSTEVGLSVAGTLAKRLAPCCLEAERE